MQLAPMDRWTCFSFGVSLGEKTSSSNVASLTSLTYLGWLFEFNVLATSKVISRLIPNCGSAHSWITGRVREIVGSNPG